MLAQKRMLRNNTDVSKEKQNTNYSLTYILTNGIRIKCNNNYYV